MKPKQKPFVSVLVMIFLSACVTTRSQMNDERGEKSEDRAPERSHSVKSEDINAGAPAAQARPQAAAQPVAQGNASQTTAVPYVVSTPMPGGYSLEELRAEMARLNGKVDELEHEKKIREDQRAEEQKQLQDKIAQLEQQLKDAQPATPALPEGKTMFQAGKDAYFNERYPEAIAFLDKAVENNKSAKETEEATYLRGDSQFKMKNYQKAIIDFSKFPEKFQKSAFHPKALLKIAESFDFMGMKEDAKAFYQDLIEKFPKTAEGKLAKKRLTGSVGKKKK